MNDSKVTDHHALIITENLPGELSKDERAVYELVAGRMLEAFSGKCVKDVTTAILSAGDTDFTVKGSVMKVTGWRAVFGEQETGGDEEAASLPPLQDNDSFFAMPFHFFEFIINHIIDSIRLHFHGKFKYILSNIVFAY